MSHKVAVQCVKQDEAFKISILDLKQAISGVWFLHTGPQQELLLGAEEPDRIAQTNAVSMQIWKLSYRGKCAYFSSHPSPLLTRII